MTEGNALTTIAQYCRLAKVGPQMQAALLLHREGYGYVPIADHLKTTEGAAAKALSEAKRLLREHPWSEEDAAVLAEALKGGEDRSRYGGILSVAGNRFGGSSRTPIYDSDNDERANVAMRPATVVDGHDLYGVPWRDTLPRTLAEWLARLNEQVSGDFGPPCRSL